MKKTSQPIDNHEQGKATTSIGAGNPFHDINWQAEQRAFASADDLLALALGHEPRSLLPAFQKRFAQFQRFQIPSTTFTPMMLYSLYVLAARSGSASLLVCGVDAGAATAALAAGAMDGNGSVHLAGSERNDDLAALARTNLALLEMPQPPEIKTSGSAELLAKQPACSADIVFLDSWPEDHPALLPAALDALTPGGLMLVHDALWERCLPDMERVTSIAEVSGQFETMLTLPLDEMGLWLARKSEDLT